MKTNSIGKDNVDIVRLLVLSVYGIVILGVCLLSISWAWYEYNVTTNGSLQSASYGIQVSVRGEDSEEYEVLSDNFCELENGKTYEVKITASGSASTGYCTVDAGDVRYYSEPLRPGENISFSVNFPGEGSRTVRFIPGWGMFYGSVTDNLVGEGDILGSVSAGHDNTTVEGGK